MVTVNGLSEMLRKLERLSGIVKGEILERAALAGAEVIRADAARRTPVGTARRRKGRVQLAQNIVAVLTARDLVGSRVEALIGPSRRAFHGLFLELGRKARPGQTNARLARRGFVQLAGGRRSVPAMAPRPFLQPAVQASSAAAIAAAAASIRESLDSIR